MNILRIFKHTRQNNILQVLSMEMKDKCKITTKEGRWAINEIRFVCLGKIRERGKLKFSNNNIGFYCLFLKLRNYFKSSKFAKIF